MTLPLADALGGWRSGLAVWGPTALMTGAIWAYLVRHFRRGPQRLRDAEEPGGSSTGRMPWRSRTAQWVAFFSTCQLVMGFGGLAWITPLYMDLQVEPARAAGYSMLFQVVQLGSMLSLPLLTDFVRDRRPFLALVLLSAALGIVGIALSPLTAPALWVCLFGFGVGGGSTLGVVLIGDYSRSQSEAAGVGALTFFASFTIGGTGPLALGFVRDITGTYSAGFLLLLLPAFASLCTVSVYRPGRVLEIRPPD
jgi:CP family cyanate transporter-like MFS transporter